jgi:membrane-associated phospholipid phosphatase
LKLTDIDQVSSSTGESFPSGHTFGFFATATSLSLAYPKWYVIAFFIWASTVAIPHAFRVHYPSDVVAGAIIGSGSASYLQSE